MSPEKRPSRKETIAIRRAEEKTEAKNISFSRKIKYSSLALLAAVGIIGAGLWLSNTSNVESKLTPVPIVSLAPVGLRNSLALDLRGAKPEAGVNKNLIKEMVDLEAGYKRFDLLDTVDREKEIKLSAKVFAQYSGESLTEEELLKPIQFLNEEEFSLQVADSSGTDAVTLDEKRILVKQKPRSAEADYVAGLKKDAPYASALSSLKMILFHEWFHLAGMKNTNFNSNVWIDSYFSNIFGGDFRLKKSQGFVLFFENKSKGTEIFNLLTEESYAYFMTNFLEEKTFGVMNKLNKDLYESKSQNKMGLIFAGVKHFDLIIKAKPQWIVELQKDHRESDLIKFSSFLVSNSSIRPEEESVFEKTTMNMAVAIIDDSPQADNFFQRYLETVH